MQWDHLCLQCAAKRSNTPWFLGIIGKKMLQTDYYDLKFTTCTLFWSNLFRNLWIPFLSILSCLIWTPPSQQVKKQAVERTRYSLSGEMCWARLGEENKQRHSVVSVGNDDFNKRHTKCPVIIEETCKKEQEEVTSERD